MGGWMDGQIDIHPYISKPTCHFRIVVHRKEKSLSMSKFPWTSTKIQKCGLEEKASCHSLKHSFTIVYIFFSKKNMLTDLLFQLWQENHQRKQEQEAPEKLVKGQDVVPLSSHQAIQPHPQLPSWKPAPGRPSLCKDHPHRKRRCDVHVKCGTNDPPCPSQLVRVIAHLFVQLSKWYLSLQLSHKWLKSPPLTAHFQVPSPAPGTDQLLIFLNEWVKSQLTWIWTTIPDFSSLNLFVWK